jgi:hypothetical protein
LVGRTKAQSAPSNVHLTVFRTSRRLWRSHRDIDFFPAILTRLVYSQYDECATSEGHAVDIGVFLLSAFCAPLCLGSSLPFSKAKMKTEWKFPSKYVETMFQLVEAASSLKSLLERFIICHESIEDKTSVVVETGAQNVARAFCCWLLTIM